MKFPAKICLSIALVFMFQITFGQHPFYDDGKSKGKVRKIAQIYFTDMFGGGDLIMSPSDYCTIRYFDINGKELAKVSKIYIGDYFVFNYDTKNRLIEITSTFKMEETRSEKKLIENESGLLDQKYLKVTDTSSFIRYQYNESGKLLSSWEFNSRESLNKRFFYKYSKGNGTDTIKKYESGSEKYPDETDVYNAKGQIIYHTEMGQEKWYTYYADGKLKTYISRGESKITENYDAKGNIVSATKEYRDYQDNPEILKNEAIKVTYQYEYDQYGNWIKKTRLIDDAAVEIYEREIEYYK